MLRPEYLAEERSTWTYVSEDSFFKFYLYISQTIFFGLHLLDSGDCQFV